MLRGTRRGVRQPRHGALPMAMLRRRSNFFFARLNIMPIIRSALGLLAYCTAYS
jgi:hypothetical protein